MSVFAPVITSIIPLPTRSTAYAVLDIGTPTQLPKKAKAMEVPNTPSKVHKLYNGVSLHTHVLV